MNARRKIALGGGGYVTYAPPYPRFSDAPGFPDPVSVYDATLPNGYFLTFLMNGNPVEPMLTAQVMKDGSLHSSYDLAQSVKVTEVRSVSQDDRLVSHLNFTNGSKQERQVTVVQWTYTDPEGEAVSLEGDSFRVRRNIAKGDGEEVSPLPIEILWSSPDSKGARALQPWFAEGGSDLPDFRETPWFDMNAMPTPRAKRPMEKPSPILSTARVYGGVFREVTIKGNGRADHRFEANIVFKGTGLNYRPRRPDPKDENNWKANSDKTPKFQCEWKELERIVQHRFEMLHLLRMPHGAGKMCAPNVCAGNGEMHDAISFYAPYLVREARWLQDPAPARGVMRAFFENVKQSGQVPGRIDLTDLKHSGFYHADWGGAFEALDAIHPDKATKRAILMPMQRYVKWLANNRDPEGSGLTDIVNQSEMHQPLSRRFTIIDDKADRNEEESEQFRIKGVDASFFRYRLVKYLIQVADEMQEKAMANRFIAEAEVVQEVIRKKMWDENTGMFMDIDPKKRRKTGVKAACGFYPMASDIPTPAQQEKMLDTLGDRKEFWTKYPVPTLAITDPAYDPNGHWKGTRRETPWNGRVWTSVNGHIMDSLVYVAERGNKKAQRLCGDLMKKSIQMMSGELEGSEEASSFEHFSPETGRASHYRGVDRFLGAPVLDMVFRVACGFAVRFNDIQNDPVMADMPDFKLTGLPLGNKVYQVERKSKKFKLSTM